MLALPQQPESDNVRQLALQYSERQSGVVGVTLTLANTPAQTANGTQLERVYKNGLRLSSSDYTILGSTITLGVAAIAGDVFVIDYVYRS